MCQFQYYTLLPPLKACHKILPTLGSVLPFAYFLFRQSLLAYRHINIAGIVFILATPSGRQPPLPSQRGQDAMN